MTTRRFMLLFLTPILLLPGSAQAQKRKPWAARKELRRAALFMARCQFDKMRSAAVKARKLDDTQSDIEFYLGIYDYREARNEAAELHFAAALERDPNHGLAHVYLGNILYDRGERERALDEWNVGARLEPEEPEALAASAVGFLHVQNLDEARHRMRQALMRDRRYYQTSFLADIKKGAAWSQARVDAIRVVLEQMPPPTYPY